MANINKIKTAFRTTGQVTGNFGKAKVKGAVNNQIGVTKAEKVNITKPEDYYNRMLNALEITTDPAMITFIQAEITKYERQHGIGEVRL
jgi:hypothetical protein